MAFEEFGFEFGVRSEGESIVAEWDLRLERGLD